MVQFSRSWERELTRRYEDLLEKLDSIGPNNRYETTKDALFSETSIGGGEAGTAGAHQDRELVELLQNGRDAIQQTNKTGTLYVAVSNEGVLVANTGSPFDFTNNGVLEDLRKVNSSGKSTDAIGEKGVGLTSVCTIGDAYEVWTDLEPDGGGEIARLQCGPVNPTAALVARSEGAQNANVTDRLERFRERLATADLGDLLTQADTIDEEIRPEDITNLPFFSYPLPLTVPDDRDKLDGSLQKTAKQLLTDASAIGGGDDMPDKFTTAVIVHFKDLDLEAFRSALGVETQTNRNPKRLANNLWARLSYSESSNVYGESRGEVTSESLIHFGNIDHLVLDRLNEKVHEHWRIKQSTVDTYSADTSHPLQASTVSVDIKRANEPPVRQTYDQFHWKEGYEPSVPSRLVTAEQQRSTEDGQSVRAQPRILIPTDDRPPAWLADNDLEAVLNDDSLGGVGPESHAYPPYLYYPITGASKRLPFCLHANLEVSKDREKLYSDSDPYNAFILKRSAELVGDIATVLTKQNETLSRQSNAPWNLLPPTPGGSGKHSLANIIEGDIQVDETEIGLLDLFCGSVYDQLGSRVCIPTEITGDTDQSGVTVSEALLHPDTDITGAFAALYLVREQLNNPNKDPLDDREPTSSLRLPSLANLLTFLRWGFHSDLDTVDWSQRYRYLLEEAPQNVEGESDRLHSLVEAWTHELSTHLTGTDPRAIVPTIIGRKLFVGTVTLLKAYADSSGKDVADVLDVAFNLTEDSVYLLPCSYRSEGNEQPHVQLVPLESHGEGGNVNETYTRTVFWRNSDSPETTPRIPPDTIGLSVFVIDEAISANSTCQSILSNAGNDWGIVKLRSHPQYIRELMGSTQRQQERDDKTSREGVLSEVALQFFAMAIADQERDRLLSDEGAYASHNYVQKQTYNSVRKRNLLNRLAVRQNHLNSELLTQSDGSPQRIADIRLPSNWQALRNADTEIDSWDSLPTELDDESTTTTDPVKTGPTVRPPEDKIWEVFEQKNISPTTTAKLLGIVGVSTLPRVQVLAQTETPNNGRNHWNPFKWNLDAGQGEVDEDAIEDLRITLRRESDHGAVGMRGEDSGSYLDYITAPEFGPQTTAGHSPDCSIKDLRGRYTGSSVGVPPSSVENGLDNRTVSLESWIWAPELQNGGLFESLGIEYVCDVLETYGNDLKQSILKTGWCCRDGHGSKHGWTDTIPTLLNWQLRRSQIWGEHDDFQTPSWWSDDSILWAVERKREGSQTGTWLPTVSVEDTAIETSIWRTLGVQPLEDLSASEAAFRLQKIQEELATEPLTPTNDEPIALDQVTTEATTDGWKTVYSRLITPLDDYLNRTDETSLGELPYLTHIPVKAGYRWATVPIETVQARESLWFSNSQQLPWEDRDGAWEGPWVVETPTVGRGTSLAKALHCTFQSRGSDQPQLTETDFDTVEPTKLDEQLIDKLRERRSLILAALSAEGPEPFSDEHRETLELAIKYVRGVSPTVFEAYRESFSLEESKFGNRSAIYPITEGGASVHGLAYNLEQVDEAEPDPTIFTEALQVLFKRSRSTDIRLALAGEEDVLAADLDIDAVRRAIGQGSIEDLRKDVEATAALLKATGKTIDLKKVTDQTESYLSGTDTDAYTVRTDLHRAINDGKNASSSPVDAIVTATQSAPKVIRDLVTTLLSDQPTIGKSCPCCSIPGSAMEPKPFVQWALAHHPSFEDHHPISMEEAHRIEKISRIWWNANEETQSTDLREVEIWRNETHQQSVDWSWTAQPFARRLIDKNAGNSGMETNCWITYTQHDLAGLREAVLTTICEDTVSKANDTSDTEHPLHRSLTHYIDTGSFRQRSGSPSAETSHTKELRQHAFETIHDTPIEFVDSGGKTDTIGSIQSRGAAPGTGGGSELTDRPEFAEEVIFASVCGKLQSWIQQTEEEERWLQFRTQFENISNESNPRPWHNPSRCQDIKRLGDTPEQRAQNLIDDLINDRTTESDVSTRLAFVAADERGPGYDILDITGQVAGIATGGSIQPTPVEVKAVTGEPPYTVRFTVNEFRQAMAFTRNDTPYRIQLVRIVGDRLEDLNANSIIPGPGVTFRSPADLYAYLPDLGLPEIEGLSSNIVDSIVSTTLEKTIRGGYLRITFE